MRQLRNNSERRPTGFTLIEAAMTTVIVGVAFVAMLQLIAAGTVSNMQGMQITTGMNLAKNVRELSLKMPYAQLMAMNGRTYTPPIDSRGQVVNGFADWAQVVQVQPVDPDRLTLDVSSANPEAVRLTVNSIRHGQTICSVNWYCFGSR